MTFRLCKSTMNLVPASFKTSNLPPIILSNKQKKKYYEVLSKADKTGLTEITDDFRPLLKFISTQILKTWNTIFKQWG